MESLEEARQSVSDGRDKGIICPCCDQLVKVYKNPLYAASALALIRLYKYQKANPDEEWVHVTVFAEARDGFPRAGHFAELRFWGLVEEMQNTGNSAKRTIGYWKITKLGERFVEHKVKVPARVRMFNGKNEGFEFDRINIIDALGNKFNYRELMNS